MSLPTTADVIVFGIAVAGNAAAAIVDLRTRRVPNALTMTMAAAGIGLAAMRAGPMGLAAAIAGCVLGAALMLPGHVLGGTGAGDVKLLGASGALLGPALTFHAFLATAISGGVLAVMVAIHRGRLRRTLDTTRRLALADGAVAEIEDAKADNRFAYAPAIAVGVIVAIASRLGFGL
jgi:prepilin peptidase CpaA